MPYQQVKDEKSLRSTIKDAVDESKKKSKKEVDYSAGMKSSNCGICEYFIPEKDGSGDGACEKVKGRINQEMWCKLFEKAE